MKVKALKLVSCTGCLMWYQDKVGEIVPLVRKLSDCYLSREPAGYTNIVHFQDAEEVEIEVEDSAPKGSSS